ncbi:MAG: ribosome small subunit-dependent GTPase A [Gemmatimonadota bacterium]
MSTTREGVVLQGTGGVWQVRTDDGETRDASLRGRLKQEGTPRENRETRDGGREGSRDGSARQLKLAVGDRVTVSGDEAGNQWTIDEIHPRRSKLARKRPGNAKGERIIVANLDQVLVVFAAANPEPHPRMLDRFLVIAEANDLAARIVINKMDLADEASTRARFAEFEAAGYPMHLTSVSENRGLEALHAEIAGRGSALTGPSGVGKSSLMNTLFPGLNLRTAEISDSVNKGRHTTVGALLHALPGGGFIADTPGLREVGLWGVEPNEIPACFPEFRPYLGECRFADCMHTVEPGCAIRDAVAAGTLSRGRYDSYVKLRDELAVASADVW